jgi:high affinity Mn2+ porin
MRKYLFNILILIAYLRLDAQDSSALFKDSSWSFHFQLTVISQAHPGFKAAYGGMNSLADTVEFGATSITTTIYIGKRLWKGAGFFLDPELSGGRGLSYALGVAGALNGETYRIGDPAPVVSIARAYIQQSIPLSNATYEDVDDDENQVKGQIPNNRISITAGKFSMSDFYDKSSYSHDPRTQFLNWSLMSNGAWDYPANTKGYTYGVVAELIKPKWELAISSVAVPKIANHPQMEYVLTKAYSETGEFSKELAFKKRKGVIRFLVSYTASRAPSYEEGLSALKTGDTTLLKVISGNAENNIFGGKKFGVFLNVEQEITENIGAFGRLGWNDGKYATWAFTEIDQTASSGLSFKGASWKRNDDAAGLAVVINGISSGHRLFLEEGGYGFIIGDGRLNYGHEVILEGYYSAKIFDKFWLSFDYQFVNNPGYNKDRGPVNVFSLRGHVAF